MNIRHWQHFLRIAEHGSMSRASERLGIGQPVLSREMRDLEASLGAALFKRQGRGVVLTAAGEAFRRRAETILQQIARVSADVMSTAKEPSDTLWIAFPPSLAGLISVEAIARFRRRFPAVRLRVREGTSVQIRDALLAREVEVGVLSLPLAEPQLTLEPLFSEPMMLIGPRSDEVEIRKMVTVGDLAGLPLILGTKPNSARVIVENAMEALGLACAPVIETDAAPIAAFVQHGLGFSVAPACFTIGRWPDDLAFAPIEGLQITWALASYRDGDVSIAAVRMQEIVRALVVEAVTRVPWTMRCLQVGQPVT